MVMTRKANVLGIPFKLSFFIRRVSLFKLTSTLTLAEATIAISLILCFEMVVKVS